MLFIIGINLVFGFTMRGIDNWGHIGGLVGGALVAIGLLPRYKTPDIYAPGETQEIQQEGRTLHSLIWVSICIGILAVAIQFVTRSIHGG
jgi:hypothetical protein